MSGGLIAAGVGAAGSIAGASGGKGGDGGGAAGAPVMYDPFAKEREKYMKQLSSFMSDPSRIYETDAYKARFAGGQRAVESSAAARGLLDSGALGIELAQYGQKTAADEYQAEFNRLQQLAGVGISPSWSSPTPGGAQQSNPWGQLAGEAANAPWGEWFGGGGSSPTAPTYGQNLIGGSAFL